MTKLPGAIVKCGVFKGASLCRFAKFRRLLEEQSARKLVGFDIFGEFPSTDYEPDKPHLDRFISAAGNESITREQLTNVLQQTGTAINVELIEGDILETVPAYSRENPEFQIVLR